MAAAILITGLLCLAGKAAAQQTYAGPPDLGVYHGCFTIISLPDKACGKPEQCQAICADYGGLWAWTLDAAYCVTEDNLQASSSCHTPCGNTFSDGLCTPDGVECDGYPVYKCPVPSYTLSSPTPSPPTTSPGSTTCIVSIVSTSPHSSTSTHSTTLLVSLPCTVTLPTPKTYVVPPSATCNTKFTVECGQGPPTLCLPPSSGYTITLPPGSSGSTPTPYSTSQTTLSTTAAAGTKASPSTSTVSTSSAGAVRLSIGALAVFLAVVIVAAQ